MSSTPLIVLRTRTCAFEIATAGSLCAIKRKPGGRDLLAVGEPAPLLQIRVGGVFHAPTSARLERGPDRLILAFESAGAEVVVAASAKTTHVTFEILSFSCRGELELVLWGPYPVAIAQTVGEVVGVVRDARDAVGIQALNAKTLGGMPANENDVELEPIVDDRGLYPHLDDALRKDQLFRGDAARYTPFGSSLQAYCRERGRERVVANWGHERFTVRPFADGGVVGSKIALFACSARRALATIGEIELEESLPHPLLNGVWAKTAPDASCAYLIVDFGEADVDRAIELTKAAGLNYLYHSSPFETWGHFKLKADLFPHGEDGLRTCVEKARAAGVRIGLHTLSNFITPNDPYVSPTPDPRLARVGEAALQADLDESMVEIAVSDPEPFRKQTCMNAAIIGRELIRYASVSDAPPWKLLGCERAAWNTTAEPHRLGDPVGRLMDHDYQVFLTDADLAIEVARRLGELCNRCGTLQISLDGLEGNWSTGMGQYGRTLFTEAWFGALRPEQRNDHINDASNPGHFNWHIATRMNWGEPWYAGFRESQTLYRFKNQLFFERNLMPDMLGWFALRPETTLADAEWMLARASGYHAGFALALSAESTAQLTAAQPGVEAAAATEILAAVREWETARLSGAFSPTLRKLLRDNSREFHLEPDGPSSWLLYPVTAGRRGRPYRVKSRRV